MNAFVRVEPHELHLVIRLPLHVVTPVRFPTNGLTIDLEKAGPATRQVLTALGQGITLEEDGRPLVPTSAAGRLSLPSDRSFATYDEAVAHVSQPVAPGTGIYVDQGYFDAHLTYSINSPKSVFAIRTTLAPALKDYLKLAVRYMPLDEGSQAMVITSRSGSVHLNPTWFQAATGFVTLGIAHILSGADHLLFLLCLMIPLRAFREVLVIITGFTVAHSVTLLGSAFNLAPAGLWFPPFVETMIAASIVFMALENIIGVDLRRRFLLTALFGLVHGFGFSYGLRQDLQFAGKHLLVSLLSFNVGIEIGQLLVLIVMLPAIALCLRYVLTGPWGAIILSAIVAHIGWHWMEERWDVLWQVPWPQFSGTEFEILGRWIAVLIAAAVALRFLARRTRVVSRAPVSREET